MQQISRRAALAGFSTGALIVSPETAFGSQANSAVSFGIIGTGNRGRYVGTLFVKDPRSRLAAICDIFPDRIDLAKTQVPGADQARAFRNYQELLAEAGIDAVLIATPVFLHPEHFDAAVNAKKHIYCEKPAGADVPGVLRLMRAAKRADPSKTILFGFQQRFGPEYLAAEKILRSGQLGELLMMKSFWMVGGVRFPSSVPNVPPATEEEKIRRWYSWRATSGDFIVEQDCHGVDVLNWFAQAHPVKAQGTGGRRKRPYGDNRDHYNITYEYPGGLVGWLLATQLAQGGFSDVKEQFFGTLGTLETARSYYKWMRARNDVVQGKAQRDITADAVEAFLTKVLANQPDNQGVMAAESTLTSLLGRLAVDLGREVTWDELLRS